MTSAPTERTSEEATTRERIARLSDLSIWRETSEREKRWWRSRRKRFSHSEGEGFEGRVYEASCPAVRSRYDVSRGGKGRGVREKREIG